MWALVKSALGDPAIATLVGIFIGGGITWLAAWIYYKKAGDELKKETALLRKANMAIVYMLEHPNAKAEVSRDAEGNPVGLIVSARGEAHGKSTAKGVMSDAKGDS